MKFLRLSSPVFALLCIVLLIPGNGLAVWKRHKNKGLASSRFMTVRTTAYTHSESDHIVYGRKNALDTRLQSTRKYTSAASDWSRFPVGTTFKIKGMNRTFVIDDYGSALVGTDTIDLYQTSRKAMNKWGVRYVQIEILKWGDYEKSRQVLNERKGYRHIRKMLAGIKNPKKRRANPFINTSPATLPPEPRSALPATVPIGGGRAREFRPMEMASAPAFQNRPRSLPQSTEYPLARPVENLPPGQSASSYTIAAAGYPATTSNQPPAREKRGPFAALGRKLFGRERAASTRTRKFRPLEQSVSVAISEPVKEDNRNATTETNSSQPVRRPRSFRPID